MIYGIGIDVIQPHRVARLLDKYGERFVNRVLTHLEKPRYARSAQPVLFLANRFAAEVPSTITFEFNSANLTAESRAILDKQATWISQFPEIRFRVYGHTDLVGSDGYNQALGLRRARAVVAYFGSRGISTSRLEAVASLGETQPVIATQEPEMRNRRTVTEVRGFVRGHPTLLNGKYAEVIFREYVDSGTRPHTPPTAIESAVDPSE